MGQTNRVSHVLYSDECRSGQHLEISLCRLRKWWRGFFDPLRPGAASYGSPHVLPWSLLGSIRQQGQREDVWEFSSSSQRFVSDYCCKIFFFKWCVLGVGFGQLVGTICVATYYCSLMAITLFYLVNSFTSDLPWASCNAEWDNVSWVKSGNITCVPSNSQENPDSTGTEMSSAELYFR